MTVDFFYFRWALDEDNHPWVRHECLDGKIDTWRVPPPWRLMPDDSIQPSFQCVLCDRHVVLTKVDLVSFDELTRSHR